MYHSIFDWENFIYNKQRKISRDITVIGIICVIIVVIGIEFWNW